MRDSMNRTKKRLCIIISMFIYVSLLLTPQPADAFSEQVIQKGATGDDVVELQARLQYIGFYDGNIDGVFGWGTYWAVRNFQSEFGMDVDGLVGDQMKNMLERATDYDKEWVHRMIREGRKFTYYGGTPKEIQKGPKGSKDSKGTQKKPKGGQEGQRGQKGTPSPEQEAPGQGQEAPETGQGGASEQPQQQPDQAQQTPGQGEETPPGETPPETGQQQGEQPGEGAPPEETTPETPAPEEEAVEPQDDDIGVESAINVPEGFTDNDIQIMAQAVYGEARGEPYVGQVAVAAVILNRLRSPTFPNTVSGVIFEPRAFTAVADGQIYLEPNETARKAVLDAINGQDPSGNAMYYFNPDTATSGWIWSRPQIKRIGKHIFCK
ncbi:cell wall hydrolase [Evansella tamaricis]|uniref:Cell wall hydrolase n=1 Tax=Evansella tamaricis TaxID=2069301 RepID=A0ABS6JKQ2_9BACI|nr:cell wall hydrolase [Evansella tamaricis]MBU9714259.1 cell wall hydrolase [Evansella tamaricis]